MMDERIKKLKFSKEYLATHIANKKKRIKKVVAGEKLDRGAEKREKILQFLVASESFSDTGDDASLGQEDLPKTVKKRTSDELGEEDEIRQRRYNEKRGRWEWEIGDNEHTLWEPKESLLDDDGDEVQILKDFENANPYDEQSEGPGNVLTQGSRYVFNHTRKLASAQVRKIIYQLRNNNVDFFHRYQITSRYAGRIETTQN